jgi:hypothetical protein
MMYIGIGIVSFSIPEFQKWEKAVLILEMAVSWLHN